MSPRDSMLERGVRSRSCQVFQLLRELLLAVEIGVKTALLDEVLMIAALDDAPFVDHDDLVGFLYRRDAMRDDDAGLLLDRGAEPAKNLVFGLRVDAREAVV